MSDVGYRRHVENKIYFYWKKRDPVSGKDTTAVANVPLFFLYNFMGFCVYVPLPPLRGQHTVLCHPRWLPTSGLTEFAMCWGGAGFEPRTTDLQSGALPLSHLSSAISSCFCISNIIFGECSFVFLQIFEMLLIPHKKSKLLFCITSTGVCSILQPHLCLWDICTTMGYTSMRYTSMAIYFYKQFTQAPNKFF